MNDIGFYQSPGCREINEDTLFHLRLTLDKGDVHLMGVADGMGGMAAGEVASQQAVETVQNILVRGLTSGTSPSLERVKELVREAIEQANTDILARANGTKMGSTMTCAVVISNTVVVGHIGDCRAYVLSGSSIAQATEDHAVGNALTKRLGKTKTVSPDVLTLRLDQGETLLMCSDGLHGPLTDDDIAQEFTVAGPAKSGCIQAVQQALRMGGPRCDNISVVAYRNGPAPAPGPQPRPQGRVIQRNGDRREEPSIRRNVEPEPVVQPRGQATQAVENDGGQRKERLLTVALIVLTALVVVLAGVAISLMFPEDVQPPAAPPAVQSESPAPAPPKVEAPAPIPEQGATQAVQGKGQASPGTQDVPADDQGGMLSLLLQVGLFMLCAAGVAYWLVFIKLSPKKNRYNR